MFRLNHTPFNPCKIPLFSLTVLFLLVLCLVTADSACSFEISVAWDANTESILAGYRVFYRQAGLDYDYSNPAYDGTATHCTLSGLDTNTTYYFTARAYDIYGNESDNSVELSVKDIASTEPVSLADVIRVLRLMCAQKLSQEESYLQLDVTGDNRVGLSDALCIMQREAEIRE